MTLEFLLSVHPRSVLTTIASPNYEDWQSLVLTVVLRRRCYVSISKREKRKLRGSRAALWLEADPVALSLHQRTSVPPVFAADMAVCALILLHNQHA